MLALILYQTSMSVHPWSWKFVNTTKLKVSLKITNTRLKNWDPSKFSDRQRDSITSLARSDFFIVLSYRTSRETRVGSSQTAWMKQVSSTAFVRLKRRATSVPINAPVSPPAAFVVVISQS